MRKFTFLAMVAALSLVLISNAYAKKDSTPVNEAGKTAANFKLPDLSGKNYNLSDYKGKQPVMLFFWTTWCPFCQMEIKKIADNKAELAKSGIQVLAIDIGEPKAKVSRFIQSRKIDITVLLDEDSSVSNTYNVMGVPTFYILNKQGQIVSEGNKFPQNYQELISKK